MLERKCEIDLDTLDALAMILDEWWTEKQNGIYYAADKRHKLEDRQARIRVLFHDSQIAEQIKRFLQNCTVVYDDKDEAILSVPYENSTRLTLDYFSPCNDMRNRAKECKLEDFYDELLEEKKDGKS